MLIVAFLFFFFFFFFFFRGESVLVKYVSGEAAKAFDPLAFAQVPVVMLAVLGGCFRGVCTLAVRARAGTHGSD